MIWRSMAVLLAPLLVSMVGITSAAFAQRSDDWELLGATRIGRPLRAAYPIEQECLVRRIDERVNRLREHGRRLSPRSSGKLGYRNPEIARQCDDDDFSRTT